MNNKDMTQEQKQLLLKDLCGRLPYGVKFGIGLAKLGKYDLVEINTKKGKVLFGHGLYTDLENCRPYLRPLSSMTDEEKNELLQLMGRGTDIERVDFYISHHFDYRCLIPMGLALPATEGMYNIK